MLSKRLEELSKDPNDPNGISELVVTALGTQGSYYICWKTPSGRYKQDGHGLPAELREWLFPANNSTRDFASLQVILGPSDGDFVASDCNGRVERKAPEPIPRSLRRASTFRAFDTTSGSRPLSMAVNTAELPNDIRQRRSATVGSIGNGGTSRRASLMYEEPANIAAPQRGELPRLTTLVPLVTRVNRFRRRPMSMHHTGAQPLVSTEPLPVQNVQAQQLLSNRISNERLNQSLPQRSAHHSPSEEKPPKPASSYVDAGVQTDDPPAPSPVQPVFHDYHHHHRHTRDSSSASSASSVFTSDSSELSTRRSSIADDHNAKQQYRQFYNHVPNPVLMGRMQDYFRSSGYRLGDSFQF